MDFVNKINQQILYSNNLRYFNCHSLNKQARS
jgi:hypothetical protein